MFRAIFLSAVEGHIKDTAMQKSYKAYVIAMAVALLVWWPANHFSYFIQFSSRPSTAFFGAFVALAFSLYLAIRVPARTEGIRSRGTYNAAQWLKYGSASPWVLFLGFTTFSLFRIALFILIGLPFVVASLAVSGTDSASIIVSMVIVGCLGFSIDMVQRALYSLISERPVIRFLILFAVLLGLFLLNVRIAPELNPIVAIQSILSGKGATSLIAIEYGTATFRTHSAVAFTATAAGSSLVYLISLIVTRRVYWTES